MIFAPVYKTIHTAAVAAIVDSRIYGSGSAPQNSQAPYITWFVVVGDPFNQLSGAPCGDQDTVQIDCWAGPADSEESTCMKVAEAVRDALDAALVTNRIILHGRDTDTKMFRIGIQAEFIYNR